MAIDDYRNLIVLANDVTTGPNVRQGSVDAPAKSFVDLGGPDPKTIRVVWETGKPETYQDLVADFELVGYAKKFDFQPIGEASAAPYRFLSFDASALAPALYRCTATLQRFYGVT